MAESSEKVHEVHNSTGILPVKLCYNDQILVKGSPAGKEMAFVKGKGTERVKEKRPVCIITSGQGD
jgi:hypothetical protein